MKEIGRLRLRPIGRGKWDDAVRDLEMLARLKTRVRHVVLDHENEEDDVEVDHSELLKNIYRVLAFDGTIEIRNSDEDNARNWYMEHGTAKNLMAAKDISAGTPALVYMRPFQNMFFDGRTEQYRDEDFEEEDEDIQFLDVSVIAMAVTDIWPIRAAARVVQRALRAFVARTRAARTIQRFWRDVSGNPHKELGDRLLRERFDDLPPLKIRKLS
jgi:hypothetical protein